ncbi:hypothetical protein L4D77_18395 [Photobacterium frigidiphilum]|uniref:hypothetical protein n=1 Tax=Photobacterium frigidiphilum TaxID=264736 RepID=UPI003D0E5DDF
MRSVNLLETQIKTLNQLKEFYIAYSRVPKPMEFSRFVSISRKTIYVHFEVFVDVGVLIEVSDGYEWSKIPYEVKLVERKQAQPKSGLIWANGR